MERILPYVPARLEYTELISILQDSERWKEAHAHFNKIRTKVTLPNESHKRRSLDDYFTGVAENAAKTAYNCSGKPALFHNASFKQLLKCELEFLEEKQQNGQPITGANTIRSAGLYGIAVHGVAQFKPLGLNTPSL